jgi:cephalosporin-C deacetylase
MAQFDLPIEELRTYLPEDSEPADFDAFWTRTLQETRSHNLNARFQRIDDPTHQLVNVYDLTFAGFAGHPVRGWFLEPAGNTGRLPCLVQFVGYGGGRSLPLDHLAAPVAGFALLVMDTRGQGAGWSPGVTPDPAGSGPHAPGFMTAGIESPDDYYYRRVYADAVRAVEAAAGHPHVDPDRVGVMGGSQGGGIAVAVAGLLGEAVKLALPDVPFLCDFRRALRITDAQPYAEITRYLSCHRDRVDAVFRTLAYFDGVNFAPRITARCLFSVGLMDQTCPPSTVYGAYNRIRAEKEIRIYPYNQHEGGGVLHAAERLRFAIHHLSS